MAQLPTMPGGGFQQPRSRADNDIYTVLTAAATVFVLGSLIYVLIRNVALLGTALPL